MPNSRDNTGSGVLQNLKTLLDSRMGTVQEKLLGRRNGAQGRQLRQMRQQLEQKTRRLQKARQRVKERDQQVADLQTALTRIPARPPIFFVVGMDKSGTGWLMKMLDAHPEVLCKGEGRFFGGDSDTAPDPAEASPEPGPEPNRTARSLYGAIVGSEPMRYWVERRSFWTRKGDPEEHLNRLVGFAVEHFLYERLSRSGKRMVGDKTPMPGPHVLEEINAAIPDAKVIHIVRDGRDQAVSWMHQLWKGAQDQGGDRHITPEEMAKRDDFYRTRRVPLEVDGGGIFTEERLREAARRWSERVSKAIEDGPSLLGDRYTEVRYEDLLERPEEEARRLFEFLGAGGDEEVLRRCVEATDFEALSGRKRGNEEYEMGFQKRRKGIAGDWKNVFTERDKAIYKETAGDLLIKLRYAEDDSW
jgi:hypothetical protein